MIRLSSEQDRVAVLRIQSEILDAAGALLRREGFLEILPVLLSPITDPLHHETYSSVVDYYGVPYQLTKSMIFHKQAALRTLPRVFCFSPNVRMEPAERAAAGRYLAEFVQLDLEVRGATRADVLRLGERLLITVLESVADRCADELSRLGRELHIPAAPFREIPYAEAVRSFGEPFDDVLSRTLTEPAWVIDFPRHVREFYDREDPARPDVLLDMDLLYPQGFGEALSGGEREHEPRRIRDRLRRDGIAEGRFAAYLEVVDRGLPRSAGFGIGIERLTRFIAGLERIEDARLFAKVPGDTAAL
jgi:asparaginyl-tRNA synthetase